MALADDSPVGRSRVSPTPLTGITTKFGNLPWLNDLVARLYNGPVLTMLVLTGSPSLINSIQRRSAQGKQAHTENEFFEETTQTHQRRRL